MEEIKELNKIKEIEIEWNKLPESFYEWFYCLPIAKRKKGNNGGKSKKNYIDIVSAFDIEQPGLVAQRNMTGMIG